MASFDSPKAAGRKADQTNTTEFRRPAKTASNQQKFTPPGVKKVSQGISKEHASTFAGKQVNMGNQVRFSPNPFGTDNLKDPLNSYRKTVKPAVANPGPSGDLSRSRKAPGRVANGGGSI